MKNLKRRTIQITLDAHDGDIKEALAETARLLVTEALAGALPTGISMTIRRHTGRRPYSVKATVVKA